MFGNTCQNCNWQVFSNMAGLLDLTEVTCAGRTPPSLALLYFQRELLVCCVITASQIPHMCRLFHLRGFEFWSSNLSDQVLNIVEGTVNLNWCPLQELCRIRKNWSHKIQSWRLKKLGCGLLKKTALCSGSLMWGESAPLVIFFKVIYGGGVWRNCRFSRACSR